ncbi:MAG: ABC transporter ATP-binding protein [Alphaproteobacteria bacterium]|nr:ABC transporter ATP-binding protein [Alphaproteobacteria bacterium]
MPSATAAPLLAVDALTIAFPSRTGPRRVVDGLSYAIAGGRTLGVVGESGCGKTVAALALLRLVPPPGRIEAGAIRLVGEDVMALDAAGLKRHRGQRAAMVFQDPTAALNPVYPIGAQVAEAFTLHRAMDAREAREAAVEMIAHVGIPDARRRAEAYPHQLSGGMRQRAMIAMALACRPVLLIADEPTTALDATIQAQILDLMQALQDELGTAIQFISHNLGVVAAIAHDVMVMYAGRAVEIASSEEIFRHPLHPYTQALLETLPRLGARRDTLPSIRGAVPRAGAISPGCRFADRCPRADAGCRAAEPPLAYVGAGRHVACYKA